MQPQSSPQINVDDKTIEFALHDDFTAHVSLGGTSKQVDFENNVNFML